MTNDTLLRVVVVGKLLTVFKTSVGGASGLLLDNHNSMFITNCI